MGDPERRGDEEAGAGEERAPLGILFLAAAVGLALLLAVIALLAFAAMAPRAPDPAGGAGSIGAEAACPASG